MDTTTKQVLSDLHKEAVSNHYSKATWKSILSSKLDANKLEEVSKAARVGMAHLRDQAIVDLAIREYPWMSNEMQVEENQFTTTKEKNPKKHMVSKPSWIDRIRDTGVVRPKDLIHLSNIIDLAENREAIESMDW